MSLEVGLLIYMGFIVLTCAGAAFYFHGLNRSTRNRRGFNHFSERIPEYFFFGMALVFSFMGYFMAYILAIDLGASTELLNLMGSAIWMFGFIIFGIIVFSVMWGISAFKEAAVAGEDERE